MNNDALNAAIANAFCDTPAIWTHDGIQINILLAIEITPKSVSADQYQIDSFENMLAACPASSVPGIVRNDAIQIDDQDYVVLQIKTDASKWTTLELEKK